MNTFPESFNRKTCIDRMTAIQKELVKETRETFYKAISSYTEECNPIMILTFPDRLWHEHKVTIAKELLDRFGKIILKSMGTQADITKPITDIEDFPKNVNVKKIIIEFSMNTY